MQFNENITIDEAFKELDRVIYLESPDIWINISSKLNNKEFDEMVLFFSIKYGVATILNHAINNKLVDLNKESENKSYKTIGEHLMAAALQGNKIDIYNYLKKLEYLGDDDNLKNKDLIEDNKLNNSKTQPDSNDDIYIPEFKCPSCSVNIFEFGYKACEDIVYKFDSNKNKLIEVSRDLNNNVICCSCDDVIDNTTLENLENICTVRKCNRCLSDLTLVGIIDKSKMTYDNNTNKFNLSDKSFHCSKCDNKINKPQVEYFGF